MVVEENKEIEKAKEYYENKNAEADKLLKEVMQKPKQQEQQQFQLPSEILEQGEENVASLLKFLIQLVLQNPTMNQEGLSAEAKQEMNKKNLLELLKSESQYKMNVFGTQGGMSLLQSKELSRQDKINLIRLGIGKNLLDQETEARLLASEPKMENEILDLYKASTITFKFVAFKTPIVFMNNSSIAMPSKLYFTFKFFTFKEMQTEKVMLRLPSEVEGQENVNRNQNAVSSKVKMGT